MGKDTDIEWCDSTLNLQMGCDGCELWNLKTGVKICYAGTLTERYAGVNSGWPEAFDKPKLFLNRLDAALKWPDLTGKDRPNKPWLNGKPRLIFLDDMGDTFTESLPLDWLAPLLTRMADTPHQWLLLTKRPKRALEFSHQHRLPENFWIGTSVTSERTARRIYYLRQIACSVRFLSAEPLWEDIGLDEYADGFDWAIVGGESGRKDAKPCHLQWIRNARDFCQWHTIPVFIKQLGSNAQEWNDEYRTEGRGPFVSNGFRDKKGGNWSEWPEDLRVREMP